MPIKLRPSTNRHVAAQRRGLCLQILERRQLLASDTIPVVFAIADSSISPTNAGLVVTSELNSRTCAPLYNPFFFTGQGFSGLAYDSRSQLWATTSAGEGSASELVRVDVASREILNSMPIRLDGTPLTITDLAFDSATNTMLGVGTVAGSPSDTSKLYSIDLASGDAASIGDTGLQGQVAIGIDTSGELYATSHVAATNTATIHQLDRNTAAVTRSLDLTNPLGALGAVAGLSDETIDGVFVASDSSTSEVISIDPATGVRTVIDDAGAPIGVAGDVALVPNMSSRDVVYQQDFEHGNGGFEIDNSGGTIPGLWHLSVGRRDDGLINHTRINSFYYGTFENAEGRGTYLRPFDHQGVIVSPEIAIPESGMSVLSFNYLLETRPELDRDFVDVSIDNGSTITQIFSRQDGTLPQTGRTQWLTATSDLSAFAGQTIRIRFHFDTGDTPNVDPEGWYVDDLRITTGAPIVDASADTSVAKTIDDATPNVGQTVTYTITASSLASSLSIAHGVTVTDTLPQALTFVSANPSEGAYDPITGIWDGIELEPGEVQTLTIQGVVNAGTSGETLVNTATIRSDESDPDDSNNTSTSTSTVNRVDVSVVKSSDRSTLVEGERVTFTIAVHNAVDSNNEASDVVVTDMLPPNVTLVSHTATEGNYDAGTHQWTGIALSPDETQTLTIVADVNAGTGGSSLTNTATVQANETDPDPANNTSTVSVSIQPVAEQAVQFIAPLSVYRPGQFVLPADERLAILGRLWHDANDDGVWDSDEEAIDGATVALVDDTATVVATTQTRAVDVNQDGEFDNVTERGLYWFQQNAGLAAGTYTVRLTLPSGESASVATTPLEYSVDVGLASPSVRSNPRTSDAPNFGVNRDFVSDPNAGSGAIIGYSWADVDLDGTWDDNELGRYGFAFYLDLNLDNEFDPELEPQVATGQDGKYVFLDLAPGDYVVREVATTSVPIAVQTFPVIDSDTSDDLDIRSEAKVTVVDGQATTSGEKQTALPNIGSFDYATLVRPADEFSARAIGPQADANLVAALRPWQSFKIENTTGTSFRISGIELNSIAGLGENYVSVKQFVDGELVALAPNLELAAGQVAEFMVLYDPAKRNAEGNVLFQSPDWLGVKTAPHSFAASDRLIVRTDTGLAFPIKLVGGSTFDSDVTHDGVVDLADVLMLDQLLSLEPVIEALASDGTRSPRFDPTVDINVRCPNGAESVTGTCDFALGGTPSREIALGDFGTLNREFGSRIEP